MQARPCVFEYVYFSRPDSILGGRSVYEVRKQFGRQLAQEAPADVDVIIPVPDSGVPAALGYSQQAGCPSSSASSATTIVGRTSSSRHRPFALGRQAQAQRQPRGDQRQARAAGR